MFADQSVFDIIANDILSFENLFENKCEFIVAVDFNCRVAERPDYVENENEFINDLLPDGYVSDDILPRKSQDKTVNEYGRSLLGFCKASGLRILNGRLGVDGSVGKYRCTHVQGSSVIDMVLNTHCLIFLTTLKYMTPIFCLIIVL